MSPPMGLVLKQLVPESSGPPAPDLPALSVSIVDIMVGNVLSRGDIISQSPIVGGLYTGATTGTSFTATSNGQNCAGVKFYRGDTHPVEVTLWQKGVGQLATATGVGGGATTTVSFGSPVPLTPGVIYCVTVFDTMPATSDFANAPTYWSASAGSSVWLPTIPQGVGNSSVLFSAGAMGANFFASPSSFPYQCFLCWFENGGNWGYGEPDQSSTNVWFPVEPVLS